MKLENRIRVYILTLLTLSLVITSGLFIERELRLIEDKVQGKSKKCQFPCGQRSVYSEKSL